jgi:hypothetical protein
MSDRNDTLQHELKDCLESNLNDSKDRPCKGKCKEMKICQCKCKCSKKKQKHHKDDNDTNHHDDCNASDDSDDDDRNEQIAYDTAGQYVHEHKFTAKQQKAQSKDTAYTVNYLNRYAYEKKDFVAFDTHGSTAKPRASFHVYLNQCIPRYDLIHDHAHEGQGTWHICNKQG